MAYSSRKYVDYHEYIESAKWKRRAEGAKRRAGHRCQVCYRHQNEVTLNAYHRTYDRLGRERASDLTVLCVICHELYKGNKRLAKIAAQNQPKSVAIDSGSATDAKMAPASGAHVPNGADATMESASDDSVADAAGAKMAPALGAHVENAVGALSLVFGKGLERIFGGRWIRVKRFAEETGYVWYVIVAMLVFFSAMIGLGTLRGSFAEETTDVPAVQTPSPPPPTATVPAVVKVESVEEAYDCRVIADLAVYDEPLDGKLFDVIPSGAGVDVEQRAQCDGEMWFSLGDGRWAIGENVECKTQQAPEVDCPVVRQPEDELHQAQCVVNLPANVRQGPSVSFAIEDRLMPGTSVGVSAYNDECGGERWYQMAEERWMAGFLLDCSDIEDLPPVAVECLAPPSPP